MPDFHLAFSSRKRLPARTGAVMYANALLPYHAYNAMSAAEAEGGNLLPACLRFTDNRFSVHCVSCVFVIPVGMSELGGLIFALRMLCCLSLSFLTEAVTWMTVGTGGYPHRGDELIHVRRASALLRD